MEYIELGNSGIMVSKLGLGTGTTARREGFTPEAADKMVEVIRVIIDRGCNFLDTAATYQTEEIIGRAVKGRREQVVIGTKLPYCHLDEVSTRLESSLKALDTDYIDLYLIHWPHPPIEPVLEELVRQRNAGKIRAIGVSNFSLEQMKIALQYGVVDLQSPYSVLWRTPADVLGFCADHSITFTAYSPLAEGILTGRYTRGGADFESRPVQDVLMWEQKEESLRVAAMLDAVADRAGCTSAQAALAWVLQTPGVGSLIVQTSRIERWVELEGALNVHLSQEDYDSLDRAGREVWERFGPGANLWNLQVRPRAASNEAS